MSSAVNLAIVGVSGAAGACARYGVSLWLAGPSQRFPYGTLAVNLSGALMAGIFATLLLSRGGNDAPAYLILITGFLGSFTTLSAFSLETMRLAQSGAVLPALINVAVTLAGAMAAVILGAWIASQWPGVYTQ